MFGAVPGSFRKEEAAAKAAEGYAIEEEKQWTVVSKDFEGRIFYKPCAVHDLKWANEDNWFE